MQLTSTYSKWTRLALASLALIPSWTQATQTLDDFSDATLTSLETARMVVNDAGVGGQSTAKLSTDGEALRMEGTLAPGRGMPGFVSLVLLLSADGQARDLSAYEGIHLRVRVAKGNLQVLAASAEVNNFDYHAMALQRSGDFEEIKVPFAELKRVWSEQTPLNLATITSINLVASGMQAGPFLYEIDEIGFY